MKDSTICKGHWIFLKFVRVVGFCPSFEILFDITLAIFWEKYTFQKVCANTKTRKHTPIFISIGLTIKN